MTDNLQKEIFSKNLKQYLNDSGKSQKEIATQLGVSPQTFNTWCQGIAIPRMDKIQLLADYFKINKCDLIDEHTKNFLHKKSVTIKVLSRVAAGIPIEAVTDVIDTEEITEKLAATGEFFGLQIHDDSMEPRIKDGDVLIVRQQGDADSGDVVIALIDGDDAICKRLRKYRDGIELISSNPAYPPMFFSNEDIEKKTVRIIGKVVELRAKF